jgi:hypothetical protein
MKAVARAFDIKVVKHVVCAMRSLLRLESLITRDIETIRRTKRKCQSIKKTIGRTFAEKVRR